MQQTIFTVYAECLKSCRGYDQQHHHHNRFMQDLLKSSYNLVEVHVAILDGAVS